MARKKLSPTTMVVSGDNGLTKALHGESVRTPRLPYQANTTTTRMTSSHYVPLLPQDRYHVEQSRREWFRQTRGLFFIYPVLLALRLRELRPGLEAVWSG